MRFEPVPLTADEETLRGEVRAFLAEHLPLGSYRPALGFNAEHDPAFTMKLAERGWVGMAIPPEYGGGGRTPVDRFIVAEELLAAGAPVGAHWVADRQTGPALLSFGTESQKQRFLPRIAAGKCYFAIGMSEPDAGSDLAAVRTKATRVAGGWVISGAKIWTSWAHRNHYFVALCRSSPKEEDRHAGLSQFIVDLSASGVTIKPIRFLDGTEHFCEVVLDDVFVSDDMVLGEIGAGWRQVTSELAFERSGPDRFLSSWHLLRYFVDERAVPGVVSTDDFASASWRSFGADVTDLRIGELTARYWTLRQMALSVARALQDGQAPAVEAAMVKDLGTCFEQEVVSVLQGLVDEDPDPKAGSMFESLLANATLVAPSYTIRGGTTEVLRSVIARDLGRGK
jgi:alkylation response protein AidB-like acyl-CoA dehydrogenase